MNAMQRGHAIHKQVEYDLKTVARDLFASTSTKVHGTLWRDLSGVTHIIDRWDVMTYDQITLCRQVVRYRKYSWLYEVLGLAPTYTNCISCASGGESRGYTYYGTVTGRMSSRGVPNLQPMPPRKRP